jgi:hypothetical protein
MAIYEITDNSIVQVPTTTFAAQGIRERYDLQRILRENVGAIAPDTYLLADEYGEWVDAKRRIDLLCIDKQANLVVEAHRGRWSHGASGHKVRCNGTHDDFRGSSRSECFVLEEDWKR